MTMPQRTASCTHNPAPYQAAGRQRRVYRVNGRAARQPIVAEPSRSQQTKGGVV